MKEIIFNAVHRNRKDGRPMVILTTNKGTRWITLAQWVTRGYSTNLESYAEGTAEFDFYQKGDTLMNGQECTDSNVVLRDFFVSANANITARTQAAMLLQKEQELLLSIDKFKRNHPVQENQPEHADAEDDSLI